MDRNFNHHLDEVQAANRQLLAAAREPNAPEVGSGYGGAGPGAGEPEPRSFESGTGGTLYQAFTELDSTETGACAM